MNIVMKALLIGCLTLPFAACKKEEAPVKVEKAALPVPTTEDSEQWKAYLNDAVPRQMDGIANQPYVYFIPGESAPDFQGLYERQSEAIKLTVARGVTSGNMLVFASPASAKMADAIEAAFKDAPAESMKKVRVLFIGKQEDSARVQAAVTPAGAEYKFIEIK